MTVLIALFSAIQPLLNVYIQVIFCAVIFILVIIAYEKICMAISQKLKHKQHQYH